MKLDRSVVYAPGRMVLPRKSISKVLDCPTGYQCQEFTEKYKDSLKELFSSLDVFTNNEIEEMIKKDRETFKKHCIVVVDQNNRVAGSIGLIQDQVGRLTIGYFGVREEDQNKGIGHYLISKIAYVYDTIPSKYPLYIDLTSYSYVCIMMLARMGFNPFMGEYLDMDADQAKSNWEVITELLKEKSLKH